jgi:hypothetical protein
MISGNTPANCGISGIGNPFDILSNEATAHFQGLLFLIQRM